ncbi:hypothetical protein KR222_005433, partial [Zaprionus bogoriensis]
FVRKVYIFATIFILIECVTWITVSVLDFNMMDAILIPFLVWIIGAFSLLIIMNCLPQTRFCFPCNWIMAVVIMTCLIMAGAYIFYNVDFLLVLAGLGATAAIIILVYAVGAFAPQVMLPGILCTGLLSCVLSIVLFSMAICLMFIKNVILLLCFGIALFCLTALMMLFNAQYIHARYEILPIFDMVHCFLEIFIHFTLIFMCLWIFLFFGEH